MALKQTGCKYRWVWMIWMQKNENMICSQNKEEIKLFEIQIRGVGLYHEKNYLHLYWVCGYFAYLNWARQLWYVCVGLWITKIYVSLFLVTMATGYFARAWCEKLQKLQHPMENQAGMRRMSVRFIYSNKYTHSWYRFGISCPIITTN